MEGALRRALAAGMVATLATACGPGTRNRATAEAASESPAATAAPSASAQAGDSNAGAPGPRDAADSRPGTASTIGTPGAAEPARAATPDVRPVGFERLTALLVDVAGWTRTDPRGELASVPFVRSEAEARYIREPSQVVVRIQDTALEPGLLAPLETFLVKGYEERIADGYRRFTRFRGEPAVEAWNPRTGIGEVTAVIGRRIVVNARGRQVASLDTVKGLLGRIDFTRLSSLAAAR